MEKRWHGSVGVTLTARDGTFCGNVGMSYPCDSQEDGWSKGLDWLRKHGLTRDTYLVHTYWLDVKYF